MQNKNAAPFDVDTQYCDRSVHCAVYRQAATRCKEGMTVEVQYIRRSVDYFTPYVLTAVFLVNLGQPVLLDFFLHMFHNSTFEVKRHGCFAV